MASTWSITELAERAAAALGAGASVRVNGRVRDLPNARLIRWYTTIGLVDPPLGRRGRTALYGPRHLLQIVAVKRRQAAGRTIAEIQVELAGATDATLRDIARLPAEGQEPEPPDPLPAPAPRASAPRASEPRASEPRASDGQRARFWTAQPAMQPAAAVTPDASPVGHRPVPVQGVRLAPGVTVLLDAAATSRLTGDDLAAIETAARPLLDELHRRGLLDRPDGSRTDTRPAEPPGRST